MWLIKKLSSHTWAAAQPLSDGKPEIGDTTMGYTPAGGIRWERGAVTLIPA